jgi:hypothetical protein
MLRICPLALVFLGLAIHAASAAAEQQDEPRGGAFSAILDRMDQMVEAYTRVLVRKYDLTDEQAEITQRLLREKANSFVSRHDGELRDLMDRMFAVRGGATIEPEELQGWGQRVRPLYEEAKRYIVDGNHEWREILTDEQRRIHDEDLRLMEDSFATTESQLDRISSGEMGVDEFRAPQRLVKPRQRATPVAQDAHEPPVQAPVVHQSGEVVQYPPGEPVVTHAPPQPRGAPRTPPGSNAAQPAGRGARNRPAALARDFEGEWQRYVREFIDKYQLNEEQTAKANSILKDCQEQAGRVVKSRAEQIEQLDKQIADLTRSDSKDKGKQITAANEQKNKLLQPVIDIFEKQLKPRLDGLPTRAQRRAAEEAGKGATAKSGAKKTDGQKSPGRNE